MAMIQRRDLLDKKDEAEHFWSEHFKKLLEMTAGKSEQETNSILVGLVSSMDRHNEITEGIMYGILTDKTNALKYFQYLNLINRDKFACCVQRLRFLALDRYTKLSDMAQVQLLWFVNRMIDLDVRETDALFNALLRQIVTGDLSPKNIWLINQMIDLWINHRAWVLAQPALLPQLLYTILSVLVDHFKPGFESLKEREVALCLYVLKEKAAEVKVIGRDLIRLVQQLAYYPEFDDVWSDILNNKQSPIYFPEVTKMRTSRLYFQLRSQPEMESMLLFIMKQVKLGNQKRYQQWFQNKYLARVENETVLPDVVRFICGCWHPPNSILSSDIVQRWVVIGWLLKSIKNQMVLAHTKRALLYDWFFFDPKSDHLMNLEPSMLLMYHSIPKFVDITSTLIDFLYNEFTVLPQFKDEIKRGINSAIKVILDKGVVPSIEPIYACQLIDPQLREAMKVIFAPFVPNEDHQTPSTRTAPEAPPQPPPRAPHRPDELKRTDSSLRTSQGTVTQTPPPIPVQSVPLTPVTLTTSGPSTNTGTSPPMAPRTTPQKPPLRKSGGPSASPTAQATTPSPTPGQVATNPTPPTLHITSAANTNKDVTVTTAIKPQAPGPAAPVKQAPKNDTSNDDWMAAWTSNIQKATREGGLVAPANASPSPLTSPLLKQATTTDTAPPPPLRKSGEGKFLNAFGTMLSQLKTSMNNPVNARNILRKIVSTFLQLCDHFVNDGNENVKSMTSDLAKALLGVIAEEFKESRAEVLFSAAHNEQNLHTLIFETYVEKKDKSILYLMKQLRKLEPSIGFRFICFLMERNNVQHGEGHWAKFDLFENALAAEGEDKVLAHFQVQLEKRKADTSQQKVNALLPYLELLKLSKSSSSSWTPQSIFIGDCKTCAEADVLLFVDLMPHLLKFAEQTQISLKGNVDFIQAVVSSVYPAQLQHLARQMIIKEVQLIGDTTTELLQSASQSLTWDSFQQYCYWQLVEAECGHHQDMFEEALPLLIAKINPQAHSEAISGLTSILRNLNPTEAMLGALLSSGLAFAPFVATLLHSWGYQLVDEQLGVNKINRSYEFLDSLAQILAGLAKGKPNTTRAVMRHMTLWRTVDGDTCQKVIYSNKGFKKLFVTAITHHKLEAEFDTLFKACSSEPVPSPAGTVVKKTKEEKEKPSAHKNNGSAGKRGPQSSATKKDNQVKATRRAPAQESGSESADSEESSAEDGESSDSAEDFQTPKTGVKRRRVSSESESASIESSDSDDAPHTTKQSADHRRKRRKVDHS